MLTGIYGNPEQSLGLTSLWVSSGKGILTCALIHPIKDKDIPIYANFTLKGVKNYHYLTIDGLYEIEQKEYDYVKILVDEAVTWIESRVSGHEDTNLYVDYILAQSRKNRQDWVMISQLKSMLDKRFRLMSNMEIWCADRRLRNSDGSNCTDDFHYLMTNKRRYVPKTLKYKTVLDLKLFDMYKTEEKIRSPRFDALQFKMNEGNNEKLNAVVDEYTQRVLTVLPFEYKNITQYMVKDAMLRLNLPLDYVSYIYARIKSKTR